MKCSLMMRRACVGYSIGVLYWVLVGSRMWGTANTELSSMFSGLPSLLYARLKL